MPKDIFFNLPNEKREKILDLAITEFSKYPYDVASISNIIRDAGISKGSFYNYFEDKKDLYKYLVELTSEEKRNSLSELPAPESNAQLFDYLRWQLLSAVYFEIKKPRLAKIAFRAFIEEIPFPEMAGELRRRGTTQFFKQLITQGLLHGDVAPGVDPDMAAFVLESLYYQFGKYLIQRLELTEKDFKDDHFYTSEKVQQLLDNLMEIVELGMKRDPNQSFDLSSRKH
jgi:AcrR family transcriptional regulator